MNEEILKRIKIYKDEEAIRMFFELVRTLITELNISSDNKRLSIGLPSQEHKRISVNINGRLVLAMEKEKGQINFRFMVNREDIPSLNEKYTLLKNENFEGGHNANLITISKEEVIQKKISLPITPWLKSCKEYLPLQEMSQYRQHHLSELYEIAMDANLLKNYQKAAENYIPKKINYWVFQANPAKVYRIVDALKDNLLSSWMVNQYKNEIKSGDKIILWVSGIDAGIYALATVMSDVAAFAETNEEAKYYIDDTKSEERDRVKLRIDYNLAEKPLTKSVVLNTDGLTDLKQGIQGTNFPATQDQYEKIVELINKQDTQRVLNLKGHPFYKISHGIFIKNSSFRNKNAAEYFKAKNWIVMHLETGKGQGDVFKNNLKIGDFIYICYGSNGLSSIGKIVSNCFELPEEDRQYVDNADGWGYREIKPLFEPINNSLSELVNDRRYWLPSGNSTIGEVPNEELDYFNKIISIPKYDIQIVSKKISFNLDLNYSFNQTMTPKNVILYGPPGTGKTYNTINHALSIIEEKSLEEITKEDRTKLKERFEKYIGEGQIVFTTFHQSMSYEDFVEGIKPIEPKKENEAVTYRVEDGIFKKIAEKSDNRKGNFYAVIEKFKIEISEEDNKEPLAIKTPGSTFDVIYRSGTAFYVKPHNSVKKDVWYPVSLDNIEKYFNTDSPEGLYNLTYVRGIVTFLKEKRNLIKGRNPENEKNKYVLIIDEINRGNVSQIFGELITLIEDDKRLGKDEEIKVTLTYSKKEFGVPPNLYIIGTMNTADRSVEALDTALRRRFSFVEMPPKPELLKSTAIDLQTLLKTINKRIEKLLDKDHLIGHSYFINVNSWAELQEGFANKILPLMQEYFYGDYAKIGLVLGKDFFEESEKSQDVDAAFFADFNHDAIDDLKTRSVWKLKNVAAMELKDFEKAINTLLRK